ncbi:putative proteasome subunit beta type-2 [Dictyocoela muelleri]|nr:putative proteasome subunit beta type-2 [Dictyocoela muelleri]
MIIKTGTTIVGLRYDTGIILCADTRATNGSIVADKNCDKIHKITDKIYCCGAGTAADTERMTLKASRELKVFERRFHRDASVKHAICFLRNRLFQYQGNIGAALILGGKDSDGYHLVSISPNGYVSESYYNSMGSGSLAAMSVLESKYKVGLGFEEACSLGVEAIKAGILNDLYSGSSVDMVVISDTVEYKKNFVNVETSRKPEFEKFSPDSVEIKKEDVFKFLIE